MKGNKLRHNFVDKSEPTHGILDRWQHLINQIPPPVIHSDSRNIETVTVSEEISNNLLIRNDGTDYVDMIKWNMSSKLANILLENDFIEMIEEERPYYGTKRITFKLKILKR